MKNLTDRIDTALSHVGKTRTDLAEFLGISDQAMSRLRGSASATLKADNVAKAARFMGCDIYWLCTGEGGDYLPDPDAAQGEAAFMARAVMQIVLNMPEAERYKAFTVISLIANGQWPHAPLERPSLLNGSHKRETRTHK